MSRLFIFHTLVYDKTHIHDQACPMEEHFNQALEVDILAASLSLERQESGDLLELLVQKLKPILPRNTQVKRALLGLGEVTSVTLCFEDYHYQISRERYGAIATKVLKIVGGVSIKTTTIPTSEWSQAVAQALSKMAAQDAQVRHALNQLIL